LFYLNGLILDSVIFIDKDNLDKHDFNGNK